MSEPWTDEQRSGLKVGDKIRRFYFEGNANNRLFHYRGTVDGQVIVRWWSKYRQCWKYEILNEYQLRAESDIKEG